MFGAAMLIGVHFVYSLPDVTAGWVSIVLMIVLGIAFSLVPPALWPAVPKIFPAHQLGTAYALIFLIQNVGLWGVPTLIGWVLDNYCVVTLADGAKSYDYTLPMIIFTGLAVLSMLVAFALKVVDKKKGYGLEIANIQK
jgi:MFS family permease